MLNKESLEKYDPSGMYKVYDRWPEIARETYESDLEPVDFKNIDHIIFAGMGGSGTIGDFFSSILSKTNFHIDVIKGYELPKNISEKTLLVLTSVSGNTDEVLSLLQSSLDIDCKIVCFSSGGKMEKLCYQNNFKYIKIPEFHSPRASFVSYLYTILKILLPILPLNNSDIITSIQNLEKISVNISSSNLTEKNPSLNLALWLDSVIAIYYPYGLKTVAIRFKNSLQENAKQHVFFEDVIEACHNGIVSWEHKTEIKPLLIMGKDDHIKTKERWLIIKDFFNKYHVDFREIHSIDGDILSKLVCLIYQLDYCSLYRAILSEINPTPVKSIDFIKNKIDTKFSE